jgi:hypothetical protein
MIIERRGFMKLLLAVGTAALVPTLPDIFTMENAAPGEANYKKLDNGTVLVWGVTDDKGCATFPVILNSLIQCHAVIDAEFTYIKSVSTRDIVTHGKSQYMVIGTLQ